MILCRKDNFQQNFIQRPSKNKRNKINDYTMSRISTE